MSIRRIELPWRTSLPADSPSKSAARPSLNHGAAMRRLSITPLCRCHISRAQLMAIWCEITRAALGKTSTFVSCDPAGRGAAFGDTPQAAVHAPPRDHRPLSGPQADPFDFIERDLVHGSVQQRRHRVPARSPTPQSRRGHITADGPDDPPRAPARGGAAVWPRSATACGRCPGHRSAPSQAPGNA
jgi:hypothetical protein